MRTVPLAKILILAAFFSCLPFAAFGLQNPPLPRAVSIDASPDVLRCALTRRAILDVQQLLRKGFPRASVGLNDPSAWPP